MKTDRLPLLIALAGMAGFAPASTWAASTEPPVNVLFIVVDDLNVDLGCYGHPVVQSPNIDRIAAQGVRFDRAYCQYPLCNPSRASFLSGRRPETTGIYALHGAVSRIAPEAVTLPHLFRNHGWFTAGVGKVFHGKNANDPDAWDYWADGRGDDSQEKGALIDRYKGGDGRPAWTVLDSDGSRTRDGLTARAIRGFMDAQASTGSPFFLAAGFHLPHLPWVAPKKFFDLYPDEKVARPPDLPMRDIPAIALQTELTGFAQPDSLNGAIRAYYACVSFTDSQVGMLLDELDHLELRKNTVIVLLGDNGFHLGDHGGLWAKLSAFDAATHVPLIIAGPGVPAGRVVTGPVELLDVYPTVLALTGFPIDPGLEGRSLVPLMEGRPEAARTVAHSIVYHYDVDADRDVLARIAITRDWRYTEWDGGKEGRELYWLPDDPGEYVNRAADPAMQHAVQAGQAALRDMPTLKPGHPERPRALLHPEPSKR